MPPRRKGQKKIRPNGEIRQSQLITTFGPGAMVDLPNQSVIIGGLNHWRGEMEPVEEERLSLAIDRHLGIRGAKLFTPPVDTEERWSPRTGLTVFVFPEWFVAQVEGNVWTSKKGSSFRTRPLVHRSRLIKGQYDDGRKKHPVVPVRFVQACVNGHISDIDWFGYVHSDYKSTCRGPLYLDEGSTGGGDLANIFVRCVACKARRPLSQAKLPQSRVLGPCPGKRPWLGAYNTWEECKHPETGAREYSRLLARHASNAYFSQILSVISIPEMDYKLKQAVSKVYEDYLQWAEDEDDVRRDRRKPKVAAALDGFSDTEVWEELQRRRNPEAEAPKTIKQVEIETLLLNQDEIGEDSPDKPFYAKARAMHGLPQPLRERLRRLVLVHRLREVRSLIGFTRFEAEMTDIDGELSLDVRRAALDVDETWFPTIENKGEGVFIAFSADKIHAWLQRPAVRKRADAIQAGFESWCAWRKVEGRSFPGATYVMLHTLSHLLLTAVSLECGYAASSIRERVYAIFNEDNPSESMYGILLFTGTPGAEGTLGGLVAVGERIEHHLRRALQMGRLCSNDPVCAQHQPDDIHKERFLHGAACHGCLLVAETCCERRNEYLDRALVVPTVEQLGAEFFDGDLDWSLPETNRVIPDYASPVPVPAERPPSEDAWSDMDELVNDERILPLVAALKERGAVPPEPSLDPSTPRGRVLEGILELAWPSRQIAVFIPDELPEKTRQRLQADGWTLISFPCTADEIPL